MITIRNYMLQAHELSMLLGKLTTFQKCEHWLSTHRTQEKRTRMASCVGWFVCLFYTLYRVDFPAANMHYNVVQKEYILSSTAFLVLQCVCMPLTRESTLQIVNILQRGKEKCSRCQSFSKSSFYPHCSVCMYSDFPFGFVQIIAVITLYSINYCRRSS